jgi:hypothetical protein
LPGLRRLEQQLVEIVPQWSMPPVVASYQAMRGASFLVAGTGAAENRRPTAARQSAAIDGVSRPRACRPLLQGCT